MAGDDGLLEGNWPGSSSQDPACFVINHDNTNDHQLDIFSKLNSKHKHCVAFIVSDKDAAFSVYSLKNVENTPAGAARMLSARPTTIHGQLF